MTLPELKAKIKALPLEERPPYELLFATLYPNEVLYQTKPLSTAVPLKEYHLQYKEHCLTCSTKTKKLYWMKHDKHTNALISQTLLNSEPEHLIDLKQQKVQITWCCSCEAVLLNLDKHTLIQMIKNRRLEHAKDHRLYTDTRGRVPSSDPSEEQRGKAFHPQSDEVRSLDFN